MRAVYTLTTLAVVAGLCLLMLKGWRSRQRRQADLPAPLTSAPRSEPLLPPIEGLFIGTTTAGDWLDRIAVHGLSDRGAGWLTLTRDGVTVERDGMADLHLPIGDIAAAAPGTRLAGKVVGTDGLLLVDWRLGDRLLTSGFRADDHDEHRRLADAITALLTPEEVRP